MSSVLHHTLSGMIVYGNLLQYLKVDVCRVLIQYFPFEGSSYWSQSFDTCIGSQYGGGGVQLDHVPHFVLVIPIPIFHAKSDKRSGPCKVIS
jgi:hypothetical protein